ncbi:hypothetical protein ACLB2K_053506 [Fragaria x ananassa]
MDLPQEVDGYIKESIDHTLGLPVSAQTLELKLSCSEEARRRLRDQYSLLLAKLKEKDQALERTRAEACMNAQAMRKFVEENQRLAAECAHLVSQCNKLEKECALYDHDREALMDFGNEADQRAKEAEFRVEELEDELGELREELKFFKNEYEKLSVDSSVEGSPVEDKLVESVLATLTTDEPGAACAYLEANSGNEACQSLLNMWNSLRPSSQKVLSVVAELKNLQKDKEHLRVNLLSAEEEVKLLFEENKVLDEANKRLLKQYRKERNSCGSGGKHTDSVSAKSNKRKSSSKMMSSSPIQGKIDFSDQELARQPLSPLRYLQYREGVHFLLSQISRLRSRSNLQAPAFLKLIARMASTPVGSTALIQEVLDRNLWDVVEANTEPPKLEDDQAGYKAWTKENAKALYAIQSSCGPEMFPFICETESAEAAPGRLWNKSARFCKDMMRIMPTTWCAINRSSDMYGEAIGIDRAKKRLGEVDVRSVVVRAIARWDGMTALHVAAWEGHAHIVKKIAKQKPGHVHVVKELPVQLMGEVQDKGGDTALHNAVYSGKVDVVKELVLLMRR